MNEFKKMAMQGCLILIGMVLVAGFCLYGIISLIKQFI
nr:MAG TPA: hypothetical protein [Caudoviricetes sp.]DAO03416.1 MAG TPA: hypothetical protein [Caudoviricetes sp.]